MRHDPGGAAIVIVLRSLAMHGVADAVSDLMEQGSPAFETSVPFAAIATQQNSAAAAQGVLGNAACQPFGPLSGFTHGNGPATSPTYDSDYRPIPSR